MKVVIVLSLALAVALAAPQHNPDKDAVVVKSSLDNLGVDGYKYGYETSNGISASEEGHVVNPNTDSESLAVRGSFLYTGPDGVQYSVTYVADDNGFQPEGAHLPQ